MDPHPKPMGGYDPCAPVRRKVRRARKQLREFQTVACGVVLCSESAYHGLDSVTVAAAAFGPGFQQASPNEAIIDGSAPWLRFSKRYELPTHLQHLSDPVLSSDSNRTVSALIILREYALSDRTLAIWRQLVARQEAGEAIRPGESMRILGDQQETLPRTFQYRGTVRVVVLENPHARIKFPIQLFRGPFDQRWAQVGDWYGPTWVGETLSDLHRDGVPFRML